MRKTQNKINSIFSSADLEKNVNQHKKNSSESALRATWGNKTYEVARFYRSAGVAKDVKNGGLGSSLPELYQVGNV